MTDAAEKVIATTRGLLEQDPTLFADHVNRTEPCHFCHQPLGTGAIRVGTGERMHQKCWPEYYRRKVEQMRERARNGSQEQNDVHQ